MQYLFDRLNPNNDIPCHSECQPCVTCVNQTETLQSLNFLFLLSVICIALIKQATKRHISKPRVIFQHYALKYLNKYINIHQHSYVILNRWVLRARLNPLNVCCSLIPKGRSFHSFGAAFWKHLSTYLVLDLEIHSFIVFD